MTYDLIIIGAGAAGAGAAAYTAGTLRVALLDCPDAIPQPCPDWTVREVVPLIEAAGVTSGAVTGDAFTGCTFHKQDLSAHADTHQPDSPGLRIDYTALISRLKASAAERGCTCIPATGGERVEPGEDSVRVHLPGGKVLAGRFLIRASGAATQRSDSAICAAQLVVGLAQPAADRQLHWLLGLPDGQMACWWVDGRRFVVTLVGVAARDGERLVRELLRHLRQAGAAPEGLVEKETSCHVRALPARAAMDFDTHVGKRSLTIGDAGGFVSTVTREGIYPALWSARLAADTVIRAAAGGAPQDVLRQFSAQWRTKMATYLCIPNTQLSLLAPLVFVNRQMASRLAVGLWTGEGI